MSKTQTRRAITYSTYFEVAVWRASLPMYTAVPVVEVVPVSAGMSNVAELPLYLYCKLSLCLFTSATQGFQNVVA